MNDYTKHFNQLLAKTQDKRLNDTNWRGKYAVCKHGVDIVVADDDCEDCWEETLKKFWRHDD